MDATPDGKNAWTEASKYQFLLRIVAQLKEGKAIKWDQINMPGRTTKSLQNMWTKVNKELQEIESGVAAPTPTSAAGTTGTPKSSAKKSGGRGRPKKSKEIIQPGDDVDDEEGDGPIPFKLAKKKRPLADDVASEQKRLRTQEDDEFARALKQEMLENDAVDMFAGEC